MHLNIVTSVYGDQHKLTKLAECVQKVQCHYPSWNIHIIVYVKDDLLQEGEVKINGNTRTIANLGRCDYAFLHYMYDGKYADVNVFVKVNWFEQNIDLYKLLTDKILYDYADAGTSRRWHIWTERDAECWRSDERKALDPSEFEYQYVRYQKGSEDLIDLYLDIFPDGERPKPSAAWGHGPCFLVSRKLLERHNRSVYEKLFTRYHISEGKFDLDAIDIRYLRVKTKLEEVGCRYHDIFLRFYKVLFTHQLPFDALY